jgi:Amt family ammonium transporter
VGALSVHLVNGVWGTLAIGLFADAAAAPVSGPANGLFFGGGFSQLFTQLVGVIAVGAYTFGMGIVAWAIIKTTMGLRVSAEEEFEGLDLGEHGNSAYPDFQVVTLGTGPLGSPTGPGGGFGAPAYAARTVAERA